MDDVKQVEVVQADLSQRDGVRKVHDSICSLHQPMSDETKARVHARQTQRKH